ncbi:MAG: DUF1080 domain-containing protein [Bacteroidales bacterium]|nr:DUF1080 domain-containing protein [Bacteroidales bacterium]
MKTFTLSLISAMAVLFYGCCNCPCEEEEDQLKEEAVKSVEVVPNTLTANEKAENFQLIFDGKSFAGWRGYQKETVPGAWKIIDGTIQIMGSGRGEAGANNGGDIVYDKVLKNFHIKLEWKVSVGGNSGIFYLGQETEDYIWKTAPEMQILDNAKHPDAILGVNGNRQAGSLYDLIPAKPQNFKGAGNWNQVEIICYNGTVVHRQNGENVVEYHLWTPEWKEMVRNSKFPNLNENWVNVSADGYFGLQDHGDDVWFRSIKLKTN